MNIFGQTKTTTPSRLNEEDKDVLTILKSQEKDLNAKIPEILRKELKIQSPSKLFGNYVATGDTSLKQKASKTLQLMQDTVNEIPNQLSKQIGQPIMRTYGGIGSALTPGDFTPTGEFQQDLFGTDKPITLTSVGRENTFRNPEEESTGIFKAVDPAVGAFLGVADVLPALPAITRIAKESKALYDSLTPLERQAGKIKTIFSSEKETAPVSKELIKFFEDWKYDDTRPSATKRLGQSEVTELSKYRPTEPVKLYRTVTFDKNGNLLTNPSGLSSWTYDKKIAKRFNETVFENLDTSSGNQLGIISRVVHPDEILVDIGKLPESIMSKISRVPDGNFAGYRGEKEVIVRDSPNTQFDYVVHPDAGEWGVPEHKYSEDLKKALKHIHQKIEALPKRNRTDNDIYWKLRSQESTLIGDFTEQYIKTLPKKGNYPAHSSIFSPNKEIAPIFKGFKDLSTKIVEKLKGRTTVSKQFISDLTNGGELKQAERDITRQVLESMKPDYRYHETSVSNLESIQKNGLKISDGMYGKGVYFSPEIGKGEASKTGLITRIEKSKIPEYDEFPNEGWSDVDVPSKDLQYSRDGGETWFDNTGRVVSDTINVKEFADKIKSELLPLERTGSQDKNGGNFARYENVTLPDELKGDVEKYSENVYRSPIKTSAGDVHFSTLKHDNYFGHTRVEDMADNKTRRVIEVQSDLYQKGNLEREALDIHNITRPQFEKGLSPEDVARYREAYRVNSEEYTVPLSSKEATPEYKAKITKARDTIDSLEQKSYKVLQTPRGQELTKLQQYNDPTAHFRMVREEIKKASQDGKTKLQFPTGETAMKIEGLAETQNPWSTQLDSGNLWHSPRLNSAEMKVGIKITDSRTGRNWIITDVLGDGKFKAVPKSTADMYKFENGKFVGDVFDNTGKKSIGELPEHNKETFDISGKVDTNNPIYKFYEKDVQKYLNKFGGKRVTDEKGVEWIEVPITKEQGKMPVEAFGALAVPPILGESAKKEEPEMFGGNYWIRNNKITNADLEEASAILFGEISNRSSDKQLLEANTILNTAFNRMDEYAKRGKPKTLTEVLQMDNQYQAYKGKQYNKFKEGKLDELDKRKAESIKKSIQKVKDGTFQNNIGKSVFYVHKPDGRILADDRKLFKD